MKTNTPLTIEEILKIKEEQLANESAFKEKVISVFNTMDNLVYRIVDGKISYQPSLLDNLSRLAKEIGNQNLLESVEKVRTIESNLKLEIDLTQVLDKKTNTYKIVQYNCNVTTTLPKINTHNNSFFQQDVSFSLTSDVEDTLLSTLTTDIQKAVSETIELFLISNKPNQQKYLVSDTLKQWAKKQHIELRIDIPSIAIEPRVNKMYLNFRLLNDTVKLKGTHKIWNYCLTEEQANVFFSKPNVDIVLKRDISGYVDFVEELYKEKKEKENTKPLLLTALNKAFVNTDVTVYVEQQFNTKKIRVNMSNFIFISITISDDSRVHYKVIKTIPESQIHKNVILLGETYEKNVKKNADIVTEVKAIYDKVALLVSTELE